MKFYIRFLRKPTHLGANAVIRLGDFVERFCAATNYWSELDYKHQWCSAIQAVVMGSNKEALITSYSGPNGATVFSWPLYREGSLVFVRNTLIFPSRFDVPFNPNRAGEFVGKREAVNEDGFRISEWTITVASLQEYLDRELS